MTGQDPNQEVGTANQKQALNHAGYTTDPDEDHPLSFPHFSLPVEALVPNGSQTQVRSARRWLEPYPGPTLAALLALSGPFTGQSTPRCLHGPEGDRNRLGSQVQAANASIQPGSYFSGFDTLGGIGHLNSDQLVNGATRGQPFIYDLAGGCCETGCPFVLVLLVLVLDSALTSTERSL